MCMCITTGYSSIRPDILLRQRIAMLTNFVDRHGQVATADLGAVAGAREVASSGAVPGEVVAFVSTPSDQVQQQHQQEANSVMLSHTHHTTHMRRSSLHIYKQQYVPCYHILDTPIIVVDKPTFFWCEQQANARVCVFTIVYDTAAMICASCTAKTLIGG